VVSNSFSSAVWWAIFLAQPASRIATLQNGLNFTLTTKLGEQRQETAEQKAERLLKAEYAIKPGFLSFVCTLKRIANKRAIA
jgi:hypothetical protein